MLSAASLYWPSREKFVRRSFPDDQSLVFLDCGGFVAMNLYGDYPWTPDEYVSLVFHQKPTFAACMDYPCEPEINRGDSFTSNRARIDATIELANYLVNWRNGITEFIPVIQGYSVEDYTYCIEKMAEADLIKPYMAVGSMCRRWQLDNLRETMTGITNALQRVCVTGGYDMPRLHWFGLHMMAVADPVCKPLVSTWDSSAWTIPSGNGERRYVDRSEYESLYKAYRRKLISLGAIA